MLKYPCGISVWIYIKTMIWSKYNRFYKISSNTYAIYNYAWNKVVFVVPKLEKIIAEHIHSIDGLKTIHPTLFASLVNGKFVTDDLYEEKIVKNHIQEKLSSEKIFRLTINPTLDCNLRCWYCYELHNNKSYMAENIITSIYKFVQSRINGNVEEVHLSFFGGEPMLTANKRAIPISQEITRICKEARKRISLHFTTNGTLLKSEVISQIANLQVPTSFQIAFDGDRDLHNKTKKWGHLSTYDVVLANVKRVLQNHMRVNVRCNYTLDNISSFYQLIDDIKGLVDVDNTLITISLQRVWQEPATDQLQRQAKKVEDYIHSLGFYGGLGDTICASNYCYADYDNSFVINYNGDVFKCTARDFEHNHRVAFLSSEGKIEMLKNTRTSENRFKEACMDCSLLPICTICSQTHIESSSALCPVEISDEDKEQQIYMHFKANFGKYIS